MIGRRDFVELIQDVKGLEQAPMLKRQLNTLSTVSSAASLAHLQHDVRGHVHGTHLTFRALIFAHPSAILKKPQHLRPRFLAAGAGFLLGCNSGSQQQIHHLFWLLCARRCAGLGATRRRILLSPARCLFAPRRPCTRDICAALTGWRLLCIAILRRVGRHLAAPRRRLSSLRGLAHKRYEVLCPVAEHLGVGTALSVSENGGAHAGSNQRTHCRAQRRRPGICGRHPDHLPAQAKVVDWDEWPPMHHGAACVRARRLQRACSAGVPCCVGRAGQRLIPVRSRPWSKTGARQSP